MDDRAEGFYWVGGADIWLMLYMDDEGTWWSSDMPVDIDPEDEIVAVPSAARLAELERDVKCPIGLDEGLWELCSAGTCPKCLAARLADANARADRLASEVERLREKLREAELAAWSHDPEWEFSDSSWKP